MIDLSVIIPNRNSQFTTKTIEDILRNSVTNIEVIVNVDEKWCLPLVKDKRVIYMHPANPIGLRKAVNAGANMAVGKYIMKIDDHCMVGPSFDKILIENHQSDRWIQIPRRYALDAENWKIGNEGDKKYPVDYMYIDFPRKGKDHDDGMHGVPWTQRRDERSDPKYDIDETPSMQGSCYFMSRNHYINNLGGMSEEGYGQFAQESQELGFKTWLMGGKVVVNKKTWYAHLHKGTTYGRMYKFPGGTVEASNWSADHWLNNREPNMIHDFAWFIDTKFSDMPSWSKDWKLQIKEMGWTS
jgi:glycosyltransferase involved in cell wall biosynthesis